MTAEVEVAAAQSRRPWLVPVAGGAILAVVVAAMLAVGAFGPSPSETVAGASTRQSSTGAYGNYRQGERAGLSVPSSGSAFETYRQGERADLGSSSATDAYQTYRQGERGDVSATCATTVTPREERDGSGNPTGRLSLVATNTCP